MYNNFTRRGDNMFYNRERIFFEKLLASLKVNGCDIVDISNDNIEKFMPLLKTEAINHGVLQSVDDLNLLFSCNIDGIYTDIHKIIDELDPLMAEKDNDNLYVIMDEHLSSLILESNQKEFSKSKMMEIGSTMKEKMQKKEKVKINAYN